MLTIADSLTLLDNTKAALKASIEAKGQTVGTIPFADYPSKIDAIQVASSVWTRPSDWLALPSVTDTDNKIVALFAVFDTDTNFAAMTFTTSTGTYTVDWGDGTSSTVASGVAVEHNYSYAASALVGTECSRGYRQAIITVTPDTGVFTGVDLTSAVSSISAPAGAARNWLDIAIAGPSIATLLVSYNGRGALARILEQVKLYNNVITSLASSFSTCSALQSLPVFETPAVTNINAIFQNCYSLQNIPLFDTSLVTNFTNAFNGCNSLKALPLFNLASCTTLTGFTNATYCLSTLPDFDTTAVTTLGSLSSNTLSEIPAWNLANVTSASINLSNSASLQRVKCTGIVTNVNLSNCMLSASALNEIYTNLGTVVGKTITVTGNYGSAASNTAIATAKGWTVTG